MIWNKYDNKNVQDCCFPDTSLAILAGMTDTITIVNYRNFKYHYHYRYFPNTDSRPIIDSQPKIM